MTEKPRRFTFRLCHEVTHYLLEEHERRTSLGLPHPEINAIAEEWLLERGEKHSGRKAAIRANRKVAKMVRHAHVGWELDMAKDLELDNSGAED